MTCHEAVATSGIRHAEGRRRHQWAEKGRRYFRRISNIGIKTHHCFNNTMMCGLVVHLILFASSLSCLLLAYSSSLTSLAIGTSAFLPRRHFLPCPAFMCQRRVSRQCHGSPSPSSSSSSSRFVISIHMSEECIGSLFTAQLELAQLFQPAVGCEVMTFGIINCPKRTPHPQVVWHQPVQGTQCPK